MLCQHDRVIQRPAANQVRAPQGLDFFDESEGARGGDVSTLRDADVDYLPVLVDRPYGVGPLAGDLDVGVGSGRGAVSVFRLIGFLGPPAEPDVPVPEHPALHELMQLRYVASVSVCVAHGEGIRSPRYR